MQLSLSMDKQPEQHHQSIKNILLIITVLPTVLFLSCTKMNLNGSGCSTAPLTLSQDTSYLKFPNVFTPNGDGVNDWFVPEVHGTVSGFELVVTNHLRTIFTVTNPQLGWDGTYNGKLMKDGVYKYTVKATIQGVEKTHSSEVTLISFPERRQNMNHCNFCEPLTPEVDSFCE
jgi:gliding motility-associated-like protein